MLLERISLQVTYLEIVIVALKRPGSWESPFLVEQEEIDFKGRLPSFGATSGLLS